MLNEPQRQTPLDRQHFGSKRSLKVCSWFLEKGTLISVSTVPHRRGGSGEQFFFMMIWVT